MALFTHLKIILLQYFQFSIFSNKWYSNRLQVSFLKNIPKKKKKKNTHNHNKCLYINQQNINMCILFFKKHVLQLIIEYLLIFNMCP